MPKRIITDSGSFPIKPSDINIDHRKGFRHLYGAFDNSETEVSAYWIVRLCQQLGTWGPFTKAQIEEVYRKAGLKDGFTFNRLVEPQAVFADPAKEFGRMMEHASHTRNMSPVMASISYSMSSSNNPPELVAKGGGWIVLGTDGKYYVTDDFVSRCFKSSPVASKKLVTA